MRFKILFLIFISLIPFSIFAQETTPEPVTSQTIIIWLPDELTSAELLDEMALFDTFIVDFEEASSISINFDIRIKSADSVGGLMSTLRSASAVAPASLPDITLMKRYDLQSAVKDNLIHPLTGLISASTLTDLEGTIELAQIDEDLWGLPYFIEILVGVSRPAAEGSVPDWSYAGILADGAPILIPTQRAASLNNVFYAQYISSGEVGIENALLQVNPSVLRDNLKFYEDLRANGLINTDVLYASPAEYLNLFSEGIFNKAVLTSSQTLRLLAVEPDLVLSTIPNNLGENLSVMDGWSWVMTSSDPAKQAIVIEFFNTLFADKNLHGELAQSLYRLPSQRSALNDWLDPSMDVSFIESMIENAVVSLAQDEGGLTARSIQLALNDVLAGLSAREATEKVINSN
ncbi:hypothetical protein MASR2M15_19110 [Anaerolineales bacterium]